MDESTEETQARQAATLSGEIDQEVGENGVLVSGGGADARVLRSQLVQGNSRRAVTFMVIYHV